MGAISIYNIPSAKNVHIKVQMTLFLIILNASLFFSLNKYANDVMLCNSSLHYTLLIVVKLIITWHLNASIKISEHRPDGAVI